MPDVLLVPSVTIGNGSLQNINGPIDIDDTSITTIDDHADSVSRQVNFAPAPAAANLGYHVETFVDELSGIAPAPIYFGFQYVNAHPPALNLLGPAQSLYAVSAAPIGTNLFAGLGSTVNVAPAATWNVNTTINNTRPLGGLNILGAAAVNVTNGYGSVVKVEADPARPLDATNLTIVDDLDGESVHILNLGAMYANEQGFDEVTDDNITVSVLYQANVTHLTFQHVLNSADVGLPINPVQIMVFDTGSAGTTLEPSRQDTIVVDDSSDPTGCTFDLTSDADGDTSIASVFSGLLNILNAPSLAFVLHGGSGPNSLAGPDQDNLWQILSSDSGVLDNNINFTGIGSLQGAQGPTHLHSPRAANCRAISTAGPVSIHSLTRQPWFRIPARSIWPPATFRWWRVSSAM